MSMPTPPSLNDAAIAAVFDKVVSYALASGRFEHVNQHEPKNAPGSGVYASIWIQKLTPISMSGLSAVSVLMVLNFRVYSNFRSEPFDMIDQNITSAISWMMASMCGDFQLGGTLPNTTVTVRNIDILGGNGTLLNATAGYIEIDKTVYRVMTLQIPIIINDAFVEVA